MPDNSCTDPIFILGISVRSGTNFLSDLLRLHPDCGAAAPIWENHLLSHVDLLARYAGSTCRSWHRYAIAQGSDERFEDMLCQCLGDGLISFLTSRVRQKRLVTKTPHVQNIEYFFKLFPHAYLLIIVRDGRAVVESTVKTVGVKPSVVNYESVMRKWADAAKAILRFDQATRRSDFKYLIVRYEDLWKDVKGELLRIFDFLDLDATTYDFDAATNLPVRGSSVFRKPGEEEVHWRPVERTPDFNPIHRWNHWNQALHERFNWIVAEYLGQFGYEAKRYETNRFLWTIWNLFLDMRWQMRSLRQSILYPLKSALKWSLGEERVVKVRRILSMFRSRDRHPSKAIESSS